ncbi:unnamed protein product [Protopolystoma xenopodis]|uniref:Endonuclease/exonuclease/phosphatase domain-containing protein n=1 Tax=Protopolystoma xenopodis TaxID=117903 RepID=A0A448X713_9PLAT|nr:unnamed protein product [Protopolystoma xenopodis]
MIDYVFFTRQHFHLLGSLDQLPDSWFNQEKVVGCPHVHVPSDHFPLLVELELLSPAVSGASTLNTIANKNEFTSNVVGES